MWPGVIIHVAAGGVGILAGFAALSVRKGERLHRAFGKLFVGAMLVMAGTATVMALLAVQRANTLAGVLTCYLVATAWLAARRPDGTIGRVERWAPLLMVAVAGFAFAFGMQAASPAGLQDGDPTSGEAAPLYFVSAGLALLCGALDFNVISRGGVAGTARIARHLWRMCFALFVAAGSFFFGQADEIPAHLRGAHLSIPPFAALGALIFWSIRVRIPSRQARMA